MSDWENMLDSDNEVEIIKAGAEKFEEEEEVKEKAKQIALPKVEKIRVKKEPKVVKELTEKEKQELEKEIERKILKQQEEDIKEMFGGKETNNMGDVQLKSEGDCKGFATMVHFQLQKAGSRGNIVAFLNEMLVLLDGDLKKEDYQKVQSKLKVIVNNKQKQERAKDKKKKKKKKKNKAPVMGGFGKAGNDDLYDMFKDEDYGIEGNQAENRYDEDDDFM